MADDGFTAFFQSAYPRTVGQLRLLWTVQGRSGAVQVYVLVPAGP